MIMARSTDVIPKTTCLRCQNDFQLTKTSNLLSIRIVSEDRHIRVNDSRQQEKEATVSEKKFVFFSVQCREKTIRGQEKHQARY